MTHRRRRAPAPRTAGPGPVGVRRGVPRPARRTAVTLGAHRTHCGALRHARILCSAKQHEGPQANGVPRPERKVVPPQHTRVTRGAPNSMTGTADELELAVADAVKGDRTAAARVLELVRPGVVRYCRSRVGGAERVNLSADDVAQEVLIAVLSALPGYRDQGRPFMAFVYGIASHKVADAHRGAARNKSDPVEYLPEVLSDDTGPEDHLLDGEVTKAMSRLLGTLPEKQREIIRLRIV